MTTEEQVQKALAAALPDIVGALKEEIKNTVSYRVKEEISQQVNKTITEWYSVELVPEVLKVLAQEKEGLIGSIPKFATALNEALMASMLAKAKENLESSYRRNDILKKLFE